MGQITRAVHLSWDEDGSEQDAAGPVQGATLPWFETEVDAAGRIDVTLHAGRGEWWGEFALSGGTLRHDDDSYSNDNFITLSRSGYTGQVARDLFEALATDSDSAVNTSRTYFSGQSGHAGDAGQLLVTQVGSVTLAVTALPDQSGLSVFRHDGGTQVSHRDTQNDTQTLTLATPSGLASVTYGGSTYIYAASSDEDGISAFRLSSSGQLNTVGTLTAEDGLWVSNITRLSATTVDGTPFVLVAGAGSGSISVAAVGDAGRLVVVDHTLDDLTTRFDNITVLETLVVGQRTYVAASGGDDGFSLFSLFPNGQLSHLATMEDTQTLGLGSISALSLSVQNGDIHLVAASESEAGLTHITYDPGSGLQIVGGGGDDALTGSDSADVILDGAGDDTMTGGAGADMFVLAQDGTRDTIRDFQLGTDSIDVSAWEGLYATNQLDVRTQSWGADIRFGDERLIVRTDNGNSIDMDDLVATNVFGIAQLLPYAERPENQPTRTGTNAADLMEGNSLNNTFTGLAGNDRLLGMDGHDRLIGGDGRDVLMGDAGNDTLEGEASHDVLYGGTGRDRLQGGTGDDTLYGNEDKDALYGDSAADVLDGGGGNDTLTGGTGADTLFGGDGNDTMYGNTGVDLLYGGGGHDWISPGNGVDIVFGDGGDDTIIGRTGWDTLHGGNGEDALYGSEGRDALYGDNGHDYLSGGFGWDSLWGGAGNDQIYGNIGEDRLYGEHGNDALYGATGDDLLVGGAGNDELFGAQGRDTLEGGEGNDFLRGGTLGDMFIFNIGHDHDTISNLEWLDQIHLSRDLTGGLTSARDIVNAFETTVSGQVALVFNSNDRIIFDTDVSTAELIEVIYTF